MIRDTKINDYIIRHVIHYFPEYETITNEYGCRYNVRTGRQIPMLEVKRLTPCHTPGMFNVTTIKDPITMGEPEKTMKYSTLCKISAIVDENDYLEDVKC